MSLSSMFRYQCTIFRENKMPVLKTKFYCKAFVYRYVVCSSFVIGVMYKT